MARRRLPRAGRIRAGRIDSAGFGGDLPHRPALSRAPVDLGLHDAIDRIQVCLAGCAAERRALGRVDPGAEEVDCGSAFETALRVSFPPETDALLRWMALRTERLIECYWPEVEAVARALLDRRSLSSREIDAVIREAATGSRRPAPRPVPLRRRHPSRRAPFGRPASEPRRPKVSREIAPS